MEAVVYPATGVQARPDPSAHSPPGFVPGSRGAPCFAERGGSLRPGNPPPVTTPQLQGGTAIPTCQVPYADPSSGPHGSAPGFHGEAGAGAGHSSRGKGSPSWHPGSTPSQVGVALVGEFLWSLSCVSHSFPAAQPQPWFVIGTGSALWGTGQDGSTPCGVGAQGKLWLILLGLSPGWQTGMPSFRYMVPRIGGERLLEIDFEKVILIEILLALPCLWQ